MENTKQNKSDRRFVLVNNAQDHIDGVSMVDDVGNLRSVVLYPGHNELDEKVWGTFSSNPVIEKKIAAGKIVKLAKPLAELGDEAACAVVGSTSDPRLLKVWKSREARPSVRTSIEDRLREIFGEKSRELN